MFNWKLFYILSQFHIITYFSQKKNEMNKKRFWSQANVCSDFARVVVSSIATKSYNCNWKKRPFKNFLYLYSTQKNLK